NLGSALDADCQEYVPVVVERDSPARGHVGHGRVALDIRFPDRLLIDPSAAVDAPPNQRDHRNGLPGVSACGVAAAAAIRVAQVDPAVLRVVRMRRYVEQITLTVDEKQTRHLEAVV